MPRRQPGLLRETSFVPDVWPLVGRETQVARLGDLLARPDARGVVLAGPAGVGKTRLASECADIAAAQGFAAVRVSATKAVSSLPLGALAPLLVDADVGVDGDVAHRADLFRQCARGLARWAGDRRLLLVVDDAHQLDDVSAALVHQIATAGSGFVLVTVRTGEMAPEPIVALWKDEIAERIEVAGLEMTAVEELLTAVLGGVVELSSASRLAKQSEGNALFLRELTLGALADGTLRRVGGVWRLVGELAPSDRLGELVEARLESLDAAERTLLELVALGEPLGTSALERFSDPGVAESLERKGLLVSGVAGRRLELRLAHPLYGDVLQSRMPRLRLMRLARLLAQAVEASGRRRRDDDLRVGSWSLLGGGGDPLVLLSAACQARRRFDVAMAERLARAAVEEGAGFDAALLAAQMAIRQGRGEAAEVELAVLAGTAPDESRRHAVAVTRIENCLWFTCRFDEGRRLAEEARASLTDPVARDQIGVLVATVLMGSEGFTVGLAALEPFLQPARGDHRDWATVQVEYALLRLGRLDAAIALSDTVEVRSLISSEPAGPYREWQHVINRCNALAHAGQLEAAETLALDWYRRGVAEEAIECQAMFAWVLARSVAERGAVATSIRYGREAAALHGEIGWHRSQRDVMSNLALALALGGFHGQAAGVLAEQEAVDISPSLGVHTEVERLQARAWVAVAGQDLPTARRFLHEAVEVGARIGDHVGEAAALHDLARLGHPREAIDRLTALTTMIDGQLIHARAAHARAIAHRDGAGLEQVSIASRRWAPGSSPPSRRPIPRWSGRRRAKPGAPPLQPGEPSS
jgi:hypothetical protein